jgi:hypothetical protein
MLEVLKKSLAKLDKLSFEELFYIKIINSSIANTLIYINFLK